MLGSGLRHVTKDCVISCFDVDHMRKTARIFASFFGGQNHETRILSERRFQSAHLARRT